MRDRGSFLSSFGTVSRRLSFRYNPVFIKITRKITLTTENPSILKTPQKNPPNPPHLTTQTRKNVFLPLFISQKKKQFFIILFGSKIKEKCEEGHSDGKEWHTTEKLINCVVCPTVF